MQWLIDLVIEAIGIPPVFIDRGDPAVPDFVKEDLVIDGQPRPLDLAGIVPAGAQAVLLRVVATCADIGRVIKFRKHDNINELNMSMQYIDIANVTNRVSHVVALDSNRVIDCEVTVAAWIIITITVGGWWL